MDEKKQRKNAIHFIVIGLIIYLICTPFWLDYFFGDDCDRYRMEVPLRAHSHHYDVEDKDLYTTFDCDIVAEDETVYPIGTEFKIIGIDYIDISDEDTDLKMSIQTDDGVTIENVPFADADKADELRPIFDEFYNADYNDYLASKERYEAEKKEDDDKEDDKENIIFLCITVAFVVLTIVYNIAFRKRRDVLAVLFVADAVALIFFVWASLTKPLVRAPIIYLYPEEETVVNVQLELNGELGTTYPRYEEGDGWTVTASPDGTLTAADGRGYSYLFWEGSLMMNPDLSQGFCVKGEDTAEFLEWALKELGLNDIEADTFIMYWLPQMEGNKYNVISFQTTAYEDAATLNVMPAPDTREGFTVVEWGGEEYKRGLLEYFLK